MQVDQRAAEREQRMRLRITVMMLTVIVIFALTWLPLYSLYTYFHFFFDPDSQFNHVAASTLKPVFQWLSMLNSCINPILYACFSPRFRQAFQKVHTHTDMYDMSYCRCVSCHLVQSTITCGSSRDARVKSHATTSSPPPNRITNEVQHTIQVCTNHQSPVIQMVNVITALSVSHSTVLLVMLLRGGEW